MHIRPAAALWHSNRFITRSHAESTVPADLGVRSSPNSTTTYLCEEAARRHTQHQGRHHLDPTDDHTRNRTSDCRP